MVMDVWNLLYGGSEAVFLNRLAWLMIISAVFTLLTLLLSRIHAAYGRYAIETKFSIPGRLAWFLQESPSFFIPIYYMWRCENHVNCFILGLFTFHYFIRTFVYPQLLKSPKPTSLTIFLSALIFCSWNGYLQGAYLARVAEFPRGHLTTGASILGIFLYVIGFAINQHADHILRNLRKPGETAYKIPRGGIFELVSGGNYFGEIVEWLGFAIVSNSLPAWAFALFTIANIGPRALQHHQWYHSKFEDYPKTRKALIPFIL